MPGPTPSMEDYIEKIYELIQAKGYARVSEIADRLEVQSSSVTKMVRKLDGEGYVRYERYGGVLLTQEGMSLGRFLEERHQLLEEFLRLLGVRDPVSVYRDVEGIEHHVSAETLDCITRFVLYAREHPGLLAGFMRARALEEGGERTPGGGDGAGPPPL